MVPAIILWTLIVPGPRPYVVDRDLTHAQCVQLANDMAPPVSSGSYKERQKQKPICRPQVR